MGRRGGKGKSNNSVAVMKPAPAPQANTAVIDQMMAQYNKTAYGPSAPLYPYPGMQPPGGPRAFAYNPYSNLSLVTRDNLTPFQILRQLADLYDGIRLCKQSWFDCAANLEPDIVPAPGLLGKNEDASKYADDIQVYMDFFESPDKQHTIHEWMNAALDDLSTIDAVAIYPRLTRGGDLYSLDLIDGSTVKPMLDDRGRTPEPPFYAYEQVVYGAPSGLYTTDQMLYLKEHQRTYSEFGFSRVENIIMRVNQALRKQSLDMAMFTDGNIPAGFVSPSADLGWTPDQLLAFQTILDSLYAGNDALRSRLKMMPPGSNFTPTNPISVETAFDLFLFNVTCASFGTTPAESGFTDDVNRATGETQSDVLYRRTLKPIALRFSRLFNFILKKYYNERRFLFKWKGYEAADDFSSSVAAHAQLVGAGIERVGDAAIALKLPSQGPEVPRFIMTKDGPFVIDDLANKQLRDMQQQAQMTGLQQATTTKPQESTANPIKNIPKPIQEPPTEDEQDSEQGKPTTVKRADSTDDDEVNTGMMLAFMLDTETAEQLAIPGGEPANNLHVTLAFMGSTDDEITDTALRPNTSPFKIRDAISTITAQAQPLIGIVGGLGRFFPAETDTTPIIALVDVPGLTEFRTQLVEAVQAAGYFIADNHGYTPHITLDYIDASAPMPVTSVPALPLAFDRVTLCVGDDRTEFLFGRQVQAVVPDPEIDRAMRADLRKWRDMAISRVTAGKPLRAFVSKNIPTALWSRIDTALEACQTVDEVKAVFTRAQDNQPTSIARKAPTWQPPSSEQQGIEASMKQSILDYMQHTSDTEAFTARLTTLLEQAFALGHNAAARATGHPERMQRGGWGGIFGRIKNVISGITNRQQQEQPDATGEDDSDYADMVAETETQNATQQGVLDLYDQYGLPVQWVADDNPCPICQGNADTGVQVAGIAFPSGDNAPPAHPRCRCQLMTADGYEAE